MESGLGREYPREVQQKNREKEKKRSWDERMNKWRKKYLNRINGKRNNVVQQPPPPPPVPAPAQAPPSSSSNNIRKNVEEKKEEKDENMGNDVVQIPPINNVFNDEIEEDDDLVQEFGGLGINNKSEVNQPQPSPTPPILNNNNGIL